MKIKGFISGLFIGFLVAIFGVYLIGYTAAIAMPKSIADYASESMHWQVIIVLWDFIVVQFLSVGVLSLFITYVALRFLPWHGWWKGVGIVFGAIGLMYSFSSELFNSLYIGSHLYGVTVLLCVLPVTYFFSRNKNA